MTALLQVDAVETYYGDALALERTDLAVEAAQCVAVIGRNGVGKTTLARTIMGLTPPRRGTITFRGTNITRWPPHHIARAGISLFPQGRRVFSSLTVEENLRVVWQRSRASRLDYVFELFPRLRERRHQRAASLSGGEQQMLAIGRALMSEPTLVILDEPTEGLAPIVIQVLLKAIGQLRDGGIAVLLLEQRVNFAVALADSIVVLLNRGRVAFRGDLAEFEGWRASEASEGVVEHPGSADLLSIGDQQVDR